MPGDLFQPVRPGDPITAETFNLLLGAARDSRRGPPVGAAHRRPDSPTKGSQVLVKNGSGSDLLRYSVTILGSVAITPTDNADGFAENLAVSVAAPGSPTAKPVVAILQEPIANGAFGYATILGLTFCKVDVSSGETDWQWADVVSSQTSKLDMKQYNGPARVIWKESGTGEKWALVCLVIQPSTGPCTPP